jgi:hypothetical protein
VQLAGRLSSAITKKKRNREPESKPWKKITLEPLKETALLNHEIDTKILKSM